jgi:antitoxin (DNA-binding transcriptional repressor) of toxin-antitoxin stability system
MKFPTIRHLATWSDLARNTRQFSELIEAGESVLVVKNSKPLAVLVPIAEHDVTLEVSATIEGGVDA